MPRRITSMMAAIAWVALTLGALLAVGRWYRDLDWTERGSVDVCRDVLLIVAAIFATLLSPFLAADWLRDRRREAERRGLLRDSAAGDDPLGRRSDLGPRARNSLRSASYRNESDASDAERFPFTKGACDMGTGRRRAGSP